jgi:amidase
MAATVTIKTGATWQEVAADRQKYRDVTIAEVEPPLGALTDITQNTLPVAKALLTAEEIRITESSVENLAKQLANSEISSVTVVKAFLRRAVLAQRLVLLSSCEDILCEYNLINVARQIV